MARLRWAAAISAITLVTAASVASGQEKLRFQSLDPNAPPLEATLYLPDRAGPHPAVIHSHTSGGLGSGDYLLAEALAKAGAAVFVINGFTPGRRGGATDDRAYDVAGAARFLSADARIDRQRLAVVGASSGGVASFIALSNPKRKVPADKVFRALVMLYPGLKLGLCAEMQPREQTPMRVPTLIIAGDKDRFGSVERCKTLADDLNRFGGKAEFRVYAGATHGFDHPDAAAMSRGNDSYHPEHAQRMRAEVIAFLRPLLALPD